MHIEVSSQQQKTKRRASCSTQLHSIPNCPAMPKCQIIMGVLRSALKRMRIIEDILTLHRTVFRRKWGEDSKSLRNDII